MGFRPTPELRERLVHAAQSNGHSVSQEIEARLTRTLANDDEKRAAFGSERIFRYAVLFATAMHVAEETTGNFWTSDVNTFVQVRTAFQKLLQAFRPKGEGGLHDAFPAVVGEAITESILDTVLEKSRELSSSTKRKSTDK